ncbi:MAG: dihydrolipoamide acetyltransferase family protein [bacterium]
MRIYLTLPKPGETIREGMVIQWLQKTGAVLEEKDPLVELETEKAVFTVESPFRGILKEILVAEGESRPVGTPLALFEVSEEDGERYLMLGVGLPAEGEIQKEEPSGGVSSPSPVQSRSVGGETPPLQYSPLIRNLAREHGLTDEDLKKIPHTGAGGRLTKEDVLAFVKKTTGASSSKGGEDFEKIPLSPIRQRIAERMQRSKNDIPHAASSVDVDFTDILEFQKANADAFSAKIGGPLTPFLFFLFAVRETLKKSPVFNSSFVKEGEKAYIQRFKHLNLGIAVATEQGLLNPVIRHAEDLGFLELAQRAGELEKKARAGKLTVQESTGATFAVNNPGAIGGVRCYQIIPAPLSAIVGLNRIQERPWVKEGQIVPRKIGVVDLSFDHRISDGEQAIRFVEAVKACLEKFPFENVKV